MHPVGATRHFHSSLRNPFLIDPFSVQTLNNCSQDKQKLFNLIWDPFTLLLVIAHLS